MASFTLGKDGKLYIFKPFGANAQTQGTLLGDTAAITDQTTADAAITEIFSGATEGTDYVIYTNAQDVNLSLSANTIDITSRATSGFNATAPTTKDSTIETTSLWLKSDVGFGWVRTAFFNNLEIPVLAMDGAYNTAGNSGLIGNFTITDFGRDEPISGTMTSNVTFSGASDLWFHEAS